MNEKNPLPAALKHHGIICIDGDCSMCNGWVGGSFKRIPAAIFGSALYNRKKANGFPDNLESPFFEFDSVILIEQGRYFTQSTAVLRILRRITPFSIFAFMFLLIPRFFRNWIYRFVAKNRHRWNKKEQACSVPTSEQQKRFLTFEK